ncbi:MAG: hypothetical protein GF353_05570 [Candidatus Lokiarchaeota archaeon]|nr:hypothetical protein [Candidatus Lokiarchaeota archaeon]
MKSKILLFCLVISFIIDIPNGYSEQTNKSTKQFGEFKLLNGQRIIGKFSSENLVLIHKLNDGKSIYFLVDCKSIKFITRISEKSSNTSTKNKFEIEIEKTNIITAEILDKEIQNSLDRKILNNKLNDYYNESINEHTNLMNGMMPASLGDFFDPYSMRGCMFLPTIKLSKKEIEPSCSHCFNTHFKSKTSFYLEDSIKITNDNDKSLILLTNNLLSYQSVSDDIQNISNTINGRNITLNTDFSDEMFVVIQKNDKNEIESRGFGKIKIQRGKPQLWNAGQFIFFRCDARIEGQMGKSGLIYQLDDNLYLKQVGSFDLNLSNGEIQKQLLNKNSYKSDDKTLIDLTNLSTFKYGPRIKSAKLKRAYQIGSYFAYLFEEIESTTSMKYLFIMAIVKSGEKEPCFLISSEANAFKIGGSHYLCYFDGERHGNLGGSDNWANINLFTEKALSFTIEHFNISDSPQGIPLTH